MNTLRIVPFKRIRTDKLRPSKLAVGGGPGGIPFHGCEVAHSHELTKTSCNASNDTRIRRKCYIHLSSYGHERSHSSSRSTVIS